MHLIQKESASIFSFADPPEMKSAKSAFKDSSPTVAQKYCRHFDSRIQTERIRFMLMSLRHAATRSKHDIHNDIQNIKHL